jgi:hypothetical protein
MRLGWEPGVGGRFATSARCGPSLLSITSSVTAARSPPPCRPGPGSGRRVLSLLGLAATSAAPDQGLGSGLGFRGPIGRPQHTGCVATRQSTGGGAAGREQACLPGPGKARRSERARRADTESPQGRGRSTGPARIPGRAGRGPKQGSGPGRAEGGSGRTQRAMKLAQRAMTQRAMTQRAMKLRKET